VVLLSLKNILIFTVYSLKVSMASGSKRQRAKKCKYYSECMISNALLIASSPSCYKTMPIVKCLPKILLSVFHFLSTSNSWPIQHNLTEAANLENFATIEWLRRTTGTPPT